MLFIVFFIVIFIEAFLAIYFSRVCSLAVKRSNKISVDLIVNKYNSVYEVYMDFNFFNSLMDTNKISLVEDDVIVSYLMIMRKIFIFQIFLGIVFFSLGIGLGLSE